MRREESGPFGKASFEETLDNFLKAGVFGQEEPTRGVSASIICGKIAPIGTGMCDLAMNVWNALARKVKHVGIAYWGGNIQDSDLTLRSRRRHGWEEYRTNKPREKRITDFED
jgi:hypothetical protein